ncbi:CDP-diacylglycerol--glycerol-3-phosphate 3-phosphatidyltransferase [Marihabitans asiaticum]|uniref:CDP-diacylglycerol--glycerol-3-phosphate 3-phosphatidyltransferase n=1 Tax=Marihabitans asiaticum TaxID=415218 RepID=A0A560W7U9_9MICO|nr:CDP-diacylglycerol--glycerol-3-phosphate 3-phosphatidyltransferase [Marihabitans asiaticum]TWD13681.1 CDP-diacylglycerol--glycerol-3-phosphate 3-phosphatidyltransferase [Marihabitans asiaticum]
MSTPAPAAPSPWNLPNALTVLRILLVPVFAWLLLREGGDDAASRWWALGVFSVAIITDRIDGDLARSRGLETDFGRVADPIADKALTGAGFIGLSIIEVIPWWITVVVIARELGITLMRFFVIRHGVMPASRGGKLKTFLQALALAILMAPLWTLPLSGLWTAIGWLVLAAAVLVTVVTAVDYVIKALTLRETSDRARMKRERKATG